MMGILILTALLFIVEPLRADIIYLKQGDVFTGTITQLDSIYLEVELSDGQLVKFQTTEIFRATDDTGQLLFDGSRQHITLTPSQTIPVAPVVIAENPILYQASGEYHTVIRFPFWPLLGGAALLGYAGVTQLNKSSSTYENSQRLEELGLEFNATRDRSLKQRTWGHICLAGAITCLLVGVTPQFEKVPLQKALRVTPSNNGLILSLNF